MRLLKIGTIAASALLWAIFPTIYTFFLTVFIVWAVFRLDPRIMLMVAGIFVVLVALFSYLHNDAFAEMFASYVFFLLFIAVGLWIIRALEPRTPKSKPDEAPPGPKRYRRLFPKVPADIKTRLP
jgi:hypothetical protein